MPTNLKQQVKGKLEEKKEKKNRTGMGEEKKKEERGYDSAHTVLLIVVDNCAQTTALMTSKCTH